jgi:hypothetical protein
MISRIDIEKDSQRKRESNISGYYGDGKGNFYTLYKNKKNNNILDKINKIKKK